MNDLAKRIRAALEDPNCDAWFPDLTADFVGLAWGRLRHEIGLTPNDYCTSRVLSRSSSAPRDVITLISIPPLDDVPSIAIEAAQQDWADQYRKAGFSFYSPDEILNGAILKSVEKAFDIINRLPSLMRTVAALVRSLHLIKPQDKDCDVSFSEPRIPFSIFVSVPTKQNSQSSLRVAEAIVHEAMHLQLTLVEDIQTLVIPGGAKYFSPWRNEYRDAHGLIHGVYVFHVIDRFLAHLCTVNKSDQQGYMKRRRKQIAKELAAIQSLRDSPELTAAASTLLQKCLRHEAVTSR
jgi:hypothetical protein